MDADGSVLVLPKEKDGLYEIVLTVRLDSRGKGRCQVLMNDKDERVTMTCDAQAQSFSMDRTQSGLTDFSDGLPLHHAGHHLAFPHPGAASLHQSLLHIGAAAGDPDLRYSPASCSPPEPYSKISVSGGCRVQAFLDVYKINP